jgi:hypothetical protein
VNVMSGRLAIPTYFYLPSERAEKLVELEQRWLERAFPAREPLFRRLFRRLDIGGRLRRAVGRFRLDFSLAEVAFTQGEIDDQLFHGRATATRRSRRTLRCAGSSRATWPWTRDEPAS